MSISRMRRLLAVATAIAAATIAELKAGSAFLAGEEAIGSSDPNTFLLSVAKGKPSGLYSPGTMVTVVAGAPPEGTQFAGWTGDIEILANPTLATTTAIVPFMAVHISANYSELVQIPAAPTVTVTPSRTPTPTPTPSSATTTMHWDG